MITIIYFLFKIDLHLLKKFNSQIPDHDMMKSVFLLLILFIPLAVFTREEKAINIGNGMPFFLRTTTGYSDAAHTFSFPSINLFIEKPNLVKLTKDKTLSVTPGLSFFQFNEYEGEGSALGGGSHTNLRRSSISTYAKILYRRSYDRDKTLKWYFGVISGVHLYTKSKGERHWWQMQYPGVNSGTVIINENAKPFFSPVYMGFIAGFPLKVFNDDFFLKPVLEFSFLPNFSTIYDLNVSYSHPTGTTSMGNISIIVGIGNKKNNKPGLTTLLFDENF